MRLQVAAGGPAALKVVAAAEFAAAPVRLCWTPPAGQAFAGRVGGGTGSTGRGGPGAPGGLPRAPPTPHGLPAPPSEQPLSPLCSPWVPALQLDSGAVLFSPNAICQ